MKNKPIYIKIEEYDELSSVMHEMRGKIEETRQKIQKIRDLKEKEEKTVKELEQRTDIMLKRLDNIQAYMNTE